MALNRPTDEVMSVLVAKATSIGTGVAKTQLNSAAKITLPAWTKSIVAAFPYLVGVTPTATESFSAKCIIESDDITVAPVEMTPQPFGAHLGATGSTMSNRLEGFELNIPCQGGEDISVYGQAHVANTAAPYMGCGLVVSNRKYGRQRFWKNGTITSTGTSAGETTGTAYNINGAERIVEVIGTVQQTTVDQVKPQLGYLRLASSDFVHAVPAQYPVTPAGATLGALGESLQGQATRYKVSIPTHERCTIQDYFNLEVAITTAGYWLSQVSFEKVGFL